MAFSRKFKHLIGGTWGTSICGHMGTWETSICKLVIFV
jgi:hypothetical protein